MSITRPNWYEWVDEEEDEKQPCGSDPVFKEGTPQSVIEEYKKEKQRKQELAAQGIVE